MNFDPLASDAPLIVYMDIKSPYAFIAKDPTFALAEALDIAIDWRPLTLDIPSYLGSAKLDARGKVAETNRTPDQWGGVRYAYMDARRYAGAWGYALRGTEKIWDTRLIHIAFQWVKNHDASGRGAVRRFLDYVYPRFWVRELDVENLAVVLECIARADVPTEGFAQWMQDVGGSDHDEQQAQVFAAGVYGVPGYVHDGEYFFGREHLPVLAARLRGHTGPPPPVGNSLPSIERVIGSLATPGTGKQQVFIDMQQAARTAGLRITAGIQPECAQSQLAIAALDALQQEFADRLKIDWGELPAMKIPDSGNLAQPVEADLLTRSAAHKVFRARYRNADVARYLGWHGLQASQEADAVLDEQVAALQKKSKSTAAADLLVANGVKESFGFVFVDASETVHPFNGRQHLSALRWALEPG